MPITWLDKIDGFDLGDPQKNVNASDMNQIKNQHNALETTVAGLATSSFVDNEIPSGSINGINGLFDLAFTPIAGSLKLYRNGVRQEVTTTYSITGSQISFLVAPETGDTLRADYRK